jgi:hypothetical protein
MRIRRVINPVAHGFVGGVFERLAATGGGYYRGSQHPHPFHVGFLPFHVQFAHVHDALQAHQGAYRGRGYAVLPRARFRNNAFFTQASGNQGLPDGVVYFVGSGMTQVFAFQVNAGLILFR